MYLFSLFSYIECADRYYVFIFSYYSRAAKYVLKTCKYTKTSGIKNVMFYFDNACLALAANSLILN